MPLLVVKLLESWFSACLSVVLLPRVSLFQSLPELIFDICCKENADTGGFVAVLLWQLRSTSNYVVCNYIRETPLGIGRMAWSNRQQWKLAQEVSKSGQNVDTPCPRRFNRKGLLMVG